MREISHDRLLVEKMSHPLFPGEEPRKEERRHKEPASALLSQDALTFWNDMVALALQGESNDDELFNQGGNNQL